MCTNRGTNQIWPWICPGLYFVNWGSAVAPSLKKSPRPFPGSVFGWQKVLQAEQTWSLRWLPPISWIDFTSPCFKVVCEMACSHFRLIARRTCRLCKPEMAASRFSMPVRFPHAFNRIGLFHGVELLGVRKHPELLPILVRETERWDVLPECIYV